MKTDMYYECPNCLNSTPCEREASSGVFLNDDEVVTCDGCGAKFASECRELSFDSCPKCSGVDIEESGKILRGFGCFTTMIFMCIGIYVFASLEYGLAIVGLVLATVGWLIYDRKFPLGYQYCCPGCDHEWAQVEAARGRETEERKEKFIGEKSKCLLKICGVCIALCILIPAGWHLGVSIGILEPGEYNWVKVENGKATGKLLFDNHVYSKGLIVENIAHKVYKACKKDGATSVLFSVYLNKSRFTDKYGNKVDAHPLLGFIRLSASETDEVRQYADRDAYRRASKDSYTALLNLMTSSNPILLKE